MNAVKSSETQEQQAVIEWALYARGKYPGLWNLYHVPNEGKRSRTAGGIAKSIGMSKGVPDLILDWPSGAYHGLRIEMKYGKNQPTYEQKGWLQRLSDAGYCVAVCWSAMDAINVIANYMNLKENERMEIEPGKI